MAIVDGRINKRCTLTKDVITEITFNPPIQSISMVTNGSQVYYTTDGTDPNKTDNKCNILVNGLAIGTNIYKPYWINSIKVLSDLIDTPIQWDINF